MNGGEKDETRNDLPDTQLRQNDFDAAALRARFRETFKREPRLFRAPGRVNLIGEHTDYNEGFVLPVAINRATYIAAAPRDDRRVVVHSLDLNEQAEFDLDFAPTRKPGATWTAYVEGTARCLEAAGVARLAGAELMIQSNVPIGAGLSSSAALEIAAGYAMLSLNANDAADGVDLPSLARAGQCAEHNYVGAKVGIMDQTVSAMGRAAHALLLDCRSFETTLIPLVLQQAALVVCDTKVKHALASSEYNTRRAECERSVEILRRDLPGITALRDVSLTELAQLETALPEPWRRRARHVVTENERTLRAAAALENEDLKTFGALMFESHASLRDDYEVSCAELDELVDAAAKIDGTLGARMTGGGFGGCTVNLVLRTAVEDFKQSITRAYTATFNREPTIYLFDASDGASEIKF